MEKVVLNEKFNSFNDHWNPRIVAALNGQHVKVAKLKGEFVWHSHTEEDEMFLVVKGSLIIEFRDKEIRLNPGEFLVVPKGIEHRPVAHEEVEVLLFEPASTLNTGDASKSDLTRETLNWI
ncbi:MAG: cupin domain-containing protein [Saprospiraceae bacterium]